MLHSEDLDLDAIANDRFDFRVTYANNFIGAHTNNAIFLCWSNWIYIIGNIKNSFPRQTSHYAKRWNDSILWNRLLWSCHSLHIYNNELYCSADVTWSSITLSFKYDINQIVWSTVTADYSPSGLWTTYEFDAWSYVNPKDAMELWVWAEIPANTTIQLSYSIDEWAYESLATLDDWYNGKAALSINRQFYKIKFKVVVTQTLWTETPEIYDMILYYKVDKRRWS